MADNYTDGLFDAKFLGRLRSLFFRLRKRRQGDADGQRAVELDRRPAAVGGDSEEDLVALPGVVRAEILPVPPLLEGEEISPGTILATGEEGIDIACDEGALRITSLRAVDGRVQTAKDFLARRRVVAGDRFVTPKVQPASTAGWAML